MTGHPVRRDAAAPIGVFDSGVGGLTVLRALRVELPHERFIYLGDTARVPYGTKSADSVVRYALQAASALVDRGVKLLVIACNTASAVALEPLAREFAPLPVLGVIEPGAHAAIAASRNRRIAVIGTEGTIRGGAYTRALRSLDPGVEVEGRACSLLVALAEEGWVEGPVVAATLACYLEPLFGAAVPLAARADTLVLGCTHFPLFAPTIVARLGPTIAVVDSAATTASAAATLLQRHGLRRSASVEVVADRFLVTDGPERFARVAAVFLGATLEPAHIEAIDL